MYVPTVDSSGAPYSMYGVQSVCYSSFQLHDSNTKRQNPLTEYWDGLGMALRLSAARVEKL